LLQYYIYVLYITRGRPYITYLLEPLPTVHKHGNKLGELLNVRGHIAHVCGIDYELSLEQTIEIDQYHTLLAPCRLHTGCAINPPLCLRNIWMTPLI